MTHEELIEKVAKDIKHYYGNEFDVVCAKRCIATILAELQEPTEEMRLRGINTEYVKSIDWVNALFGTGVDSYETIMATSYKAMLNASPLAK